MSRGSCPALTCQVPRGYHNHPSGSAEPSLADERLTQSLKDALAMIDVRVCDHFIVAGTAKPTSFAERGLL